LLRYWPDTPARKSAFHSNAQKRPSIEEHRASFEAGGMVLTNNITQVDDILTQGRTATAAAGRLAERFPNVVIRLFRILRSNGLD
jgi:predicted amidophosphoribosyltransferase